MPESVLGPLGTTAVIPLTLSDTAEKLHSDCEPQDVESVLGWDPTAGVVNVGWMPCVHSEGAQHPGDMRREGSEAALRVIGGHCVRGSRVEP